MGIDVQRELFLLEDPKYADFQARLTPGVSRDRIIGVRIPALRKLVKKYYKDPEHIQFLNQLPHMYYDEDLLHGLLISEEQDYEICMRQVEVFLPYIDNWAVCDTISPKAFARHKAELIIKIRTWIASPHTYVCRFGIGMLMKHFLDKDFKPVYLELPAAVHSSEYYVNMMIAWFYATALAKQWDASIPYLETDRLDPWTHNKTIRKAIESRRITEEQKNYLRSLKRKA